MSSAGKIHSKQQNKSVKQSRREVEEIYFEKSVDLLPHLVEEQQFLLSAPDDRITNYVKGKPHKVGSGTFRLLTSRMIVKQTANLFSTKPRLLNLPYSSVRHVFPDVNHPEVLILAVEGDEHQPRRYEFLKFDKAASAKNCAEVVDDLGYGDRAKDPVFVASRAESKESFDQPIFQCPCEYREFDMRLFNEFPSVLPKEVTSSLVDKRLDGTGVMSVYDDGVILRSNDAENRKLWSTNFSRVHRLYIEQKSNQQFIFTVDDDTKRPNHYNLVRMNHPDEDFEKLIECYSSKGGTYRKIMPVERPKFLPPSPKPKSPKWSTPEQDTRNYRRDSSPPQDYKNNRKTSSLFENSPIYVEDSPAKVRSVPKTPPQEPYYYGGSKTNGYYQNNYSPMYSTPGSGFVTTHLKRKSRKPLLSTRSVTKEDLMRMPNDGSKWETECTTLRTDGNGPEIDDDGSVFLFVAHKIG